jgi:hypothetical protein
LAIFKEEQEMGSMDTATEIKEKALAMGAKAPWIDR